MFYKLHGVTFFRFSKVGYSAHNWARQSSFNQTLEINIFHWQVNNIPTDNIKEEIVKPENRIKDTMATYNYRVFQLLEQSYNFS